MNLYTTRLYLKEISEEDVANIYHLHTFPEVARFNTIGIPQNEQVTKKLLQSVIEEPNKSKRRKYGWAVFLKEDHTFIGEAGINLSIPKFRSGEVHYSLLPAFWNRGYATEIVNAILKFGFEYLRLHRIEAGVATENFGSIRVLEKCGMSREGLHRQVLPLRDGWKDNYHYAILESDWAKSNS